MQYIEIDSYEMGGQNWTVDYDQKFQHEKGYKLWNFCHSTLAVLLKSAETSRQSFMIYAM
jgi:hypothetical protein